MAKRKSKAPKGVTQKMHLHKKRKERADAAQDAREREMAEERKLALAKISQGMKQFGAEKLQEAPHLVIVARAGTGKTFTLIEGLNRMRGKPRFKGTPSDQQIEIWDVMRRGQSPRSIHVCAFNRSIKDELATKVPDRVSVSTIHSLGNGAVRDAYGQVKMNKWKYRNIVEGILGRDFRELMKDRGPELQATQKLVDMARLTLAGYDRNGGFNLEAIDADCLDNLCNQYEVELNGDEGEVYDMVPQVLDKFRDMEAGSEFDYADMIWLPVVNNLPVPRFDMVLVDEAQDLNACQQALVLKAGDRIIACGDDKQAIYGFAGADTESINHLVHFLEETREVMKLPLTTTYRCGKRIVAEAQQIVPDYDAYHQNPEGEIQHRAYERVLEEAETGDMIICRVNAPMVGMAFKFIANGKKATIKGNDIGDGLVRLIKKMVKLRKIPDDDVGELMGCIDDWYHDECQKISKRRNPSEAALIALEDKRSCIMAFCEGKDKITKVIKAIEAMFVEDQTEGIMLSSIHRAKGLEADQVHILEPDLLPHPMAKSEWQKDQEMNLKYVGITRAIQRLVWIAS